MLAAAKSELSRSAFLYVVVPPLETTEPMPLLSQSCLKWASNELPAMTAAASLYPSFKRCWDISRKSANNSALVTAPAATSSILPRHQTEGIAGSPRVNVPGSRGTYVPGRSDHLV